MNRTISTLLLLAAIVVPAEAQNKILVVGAAPKYDVQSFGLLTSNVGAYGVENLAAIQDKIDDGLPYILYPWYFQAASSETHPLYRPYSFSNTIVQSRCGQTWEGNSRALFQGTNHLYAPKLSIPTSLYATLFDGTTNKLTSSGAGAVATVTGREVNEECDQFGSVIVADNTAMQTNGTFTGNANGWTLSGGPAYSSNSISVTAGAGTASQNTSATRGRIYRVVYTVSGVGSGGYVWVSLGGRSTDHRLRTASGTYTEFIFCGDTANAPLVFTFGDTSGTDGDVTIDDIVLNQAEWYGIEDVDAGANTWTFDRNWCSGAVTDGTGYYCPTLIRSTGSRNTYKAIAFSAAVSAAEEKQIIGSIAVHLTSSPTLNQGKDIFENCYFHGYQVAVLAGRHLAEWGDEYDAFLGSDDSNTHSDHLTFKHCYVHSCEVLLATRNKQSVVHRMWDIVTDNCGAIARIDRGGKVYIEGCHLQGPVTTMRKRIFLIGEGQAANTGIATARDISIDGDCTNPMLIETENRTSAMTAVFDGFNIQRGATTTAPLVDVQGPMSITIANANFGSSSAGTFNCLCKDDIKMVSSSGGKGYVRIIGCQIGAVALADKRCTAVHDICTSASNGYAEFFGNTLYAWNGSSYDAVPGRPGIYNLDTNAWIDVTTLSLRQDRIDPLYALATKRKSPIFETVASPYAPTPLGISPALTSMQ